MRGGGSSLTTAVPSLPSGDIALCHVLDTSASFPQSACRCSRLPGTLPLNSVLLRSFPQVFA